MSLQGGAGYISGFRCAACRQLRHKRPAATLHAAAIIVYISRTKRVSEDMTTGLESALRSAMMGEFSAFCLPC